MAAAQCIKACRLGEDGDHGMKPDFAEGHMQMISFCFLKETLQI